jgi:hypothetical protein
MRKLVAGGAAASIRTAAAWTDDHSTPARRAVTAPQQRPHKGMGYRAWATASS